MNVHQTHRAVAASGMVIAIGIGVVAVVVSSRPTTPVAAAARPAPPPAAPVAPVAPVADEFSSSVGRPSAPASDADLRASGPAERAPVPQPTATVRVPAAERVAPVHAAQAEPTAVAAVRHDEATPLPEPALPLSLGLSGAGRDTAPATTTDAAADLRITADVKSAIADDSRISDLHIGVTSLHGVVTLSGQLATQDAIDEAKDVAGRVINVISVDVTALVLASA